MHFKFPHKTTKFKASQKVKQALQMARPQLKGKATIDEETWRGDILTFGVTVEGKKITGTLEINDRDFVIDAKLPLLWRLFEGKIEKMVAEQIKQLQ